MIVSHTLLANILARLRLRSFSFTCLSNNIVLCVSLHIIPDDDGGAIGQRGVPLNGDDTAYRRALHELNDGIHVVGIHNQHLIACTNCSSPKYDARVAST